MRKSFRVPVEQHGSLRDAVTHPFRRRRSDELVALDGVDFEVGRGEFFGIAGRNGSGKSTILKLLASIYRADRGRIRVAGRLAPFIELGVGFNPELPARENVIMNGVMMGLSRREAEQRFERVIDFAELGEFKGMQVKNYSSGMQVRLAFSVMLEVEADILLFDEVLAVGDAGFQEKCATALEKLRRGPKTIVLVTHAMPHLQLYCERAMLLDRGRITTIGDPDRVVADYMKVSLEGAREVGAETGWELRDAVRVETPTLEGNPAEEGVVEIDTDQPLQLTGTLDVRERCDELAVGFEILTISGMRLFSSSCVLIGEPGAPTLAGQRLPFSIEVENRLAPGHYIIRCGVMREHDAGVEALGAPAQVEFRVLADGPVTASAVMKLRYEIEAG